MLVKNLLAVISNDQESFKQDITNHIESTLSDLTYADFDIEANSAHYYECDGLSIELDSVDFNTDNLSVISIDGDNIKLSVEMTFSIEASADFSLSTEDSVDGDTVALAGTSETETVEFSSNVEINITYYEDEQQYDIDEITITDLPKTIDFGELEPDYD
ncbi:hypothetical protein VXS06_04565 [Photobacterium toruni]|uniref:Uncharacterized protein n=1 Tax=Photobacterium toruni TaxID=1935446 RepID=A0ABU6L4C2_9GAMM|nr:hypothetical protein [Photobacterium toruni]